MNSVVVTGFGVMLGKTTERLVVWGAAPAPGAGRGRAAAPSAAGSPGPAVLAGADPRWRQVACPAASPDEGGERHGAADET